MNNDQYLQYSQQLYRDFSATLVERTASLAEDDALRELAVAMAALGDDGNALYDQGATLISRLFTTYPDFAPTLPREILWFLGGECLHFMADEEIDAFQKLDDMRTEAANRGEVLDFQAARAKLLKLQ